MVVLKQSVLVYILNIKAFSGLVDLRSHSALEVHEPFIRHQIIDSYFQEALFPLGIKLLDLQCLTPAPNPWVGPLTLHQPKTVPTCTVVFFA